MDRKLLRDIFPFALLLSYSVLCFFRVPQLADSIIVGCFVLFSAYKYFLDYNPKPSVTEQLAQYDSKVQSALEQERVRYVSEVTKLRLEISEFSKSLMSNKGLAIDGKKEPTPSQKIRF
jgi:hypothetical protein